MKFSRQVSLFIVMLLLFALSACDKYASGPEIEWDASGLVTTYSYSGGVASGVTFYKRFNVVDDESGEIKIKASSGNNKKTCTGFVENCGQYKVVVTCSLGKKDSGSKIELECPSASNTFTINVSGYSVNITSVGIKE